MNEKSKELQSKLNSVKKDIEKEYSVFIDNCKKAQKELNFDLSDSRVLQKMSSAFGKINDANTTYYAYLKTKLKEVEWTTEAYDINELDYQVVEQVYQLIQFINEESNIKNSFDGFVNQGFSSTDLGTMAVVSYSPTIEAKELELRWREILKKMPESKKQEYYEQKNKELNEKSKYRIELAEWEKACKPLTQKREEYINSVIAEKVKQIRAELQSNYINEKKIKEDQIQSFESISAEKNAKLMQLGIFKRKEKKLIQSEIQDYQRKIDGLTQSLMQLKSSYDESLSMSEKKAKDCVEKAAKIEAEKRYPYPVAPYKPEIIKKEEREERIRKYKVLSEVMKVLVEKDTLMPIRDIEKYLMVRRSRSEILNALRRGVDEGLVWCEKGKNESYYCASDKGVSYQFFEEE